MNDHIGVEGFIEIGDLLLFMCNFGHYLSESEAFPPLDRSLIPEGVTSYGPVNPVRSVFNKRTSELTFLRKSDGDFAWRLNATGFVNDIDGGLPFWPDSQPNGQYLVKAIDAFELKGYVSGNEFRNSNAIYPEKKIALEQLAGNLKYEDNLVLLIVKLKKFRLH